MPNVVVALRSIITALPESEKRVAQYILDHPEEVPFFSIQKLAEEGGTSVASVTRLSQRAGCNNFKELKIQLAQQFDSGLSAVFEGISKDDSDETCIQKIFGGNIRSLQDTLQILDLTALIKAAEALVNAEKIIFIGFGSSGFIAGDAALRFTHLGLQTAVYREPIEMILNSSLLSKEAVLVALSHSGRTKITAKAIKIARKQGVLTIGITNYTHSPVADNSDIFLCTVFSENLTRAAAISSRISQICIIDALHVLAARALADRNFIEKANKVVENEFRE